MKNLITVASVSALLVGAALPAHATTFASLAGAKVTWTRSNTGGSLSSSGPNVFDFLIANLPGGLAGTLTLAASETGTAAQSTAIPMTNLTVYTQGGIAGTFTETYTGSTQVVNGVTLTAGSTLLSGTLSNGVLVATKQGSSALGGDLTFDVSNYSSPLLPTLTAPETVDFTIRLASGNWGVTSGTLNSFKNATASGNFSAAGVVEPASWSLMLGGIGFTGAVLRRRRIAEVPA
jgi:hypothetical protein